VCVHIAFYLSQTTQRSHCIVFAENIISKEFFYHSMFPSINCKCIFTVLQDYEMKLLHSSVLLITQATTMLTLPENNQVFPVLIYNYTSSSRMRVIYHNWSAMKQRPHPQSVAEILSSTVFYVNYTDTA